MKQHCLVVAMITSALFNPAYGQEFPDRAIRLIVPFAAGGMADISGRMVADSMAETLGQPVVVENLPGAFGMIGAETVANAPADGYTLLVDAVGLAMNPSVREAPYDPVTDIEPVGQIMRMPFVAAVNPALGLSNIEEFVAYAKANPGTLNAASSGTAGQLAVALFGLEAGIEFEVIPYQGGAPAMTAVVSGEADFLVLDLPNLSQYLQSGDLVGLVQSGDERAEAFPDIPTATDVGFDRFSIDSWYGIFRPEGVPADVAAKLEQALATALESEAMRSFIVERSALPSMAQTAFSQAFTQEVELWAGVVKDANITLE